MERNRNGVVWVRWSGLCIISMIVVVRGEVMGLEGKDEIGGVGSEGVYMVRAECLWRLEEVDRGVWGYYRGGVVL